jgi:TetR/AcrR family transcriptional regulator, regulator of cefoperazone and chloramphenicol sensitivity
MVSVASSDLTGYARVRNAALEGFARDGVKATSIRAVAKRAGVSAGLVQHHFPTKASLRDAVNAHVVTLVSSSFADIPAATPDANPFEELGERVTRLVGEQPEALRYAARAIVEDDEAALDLFDSFVAIARAQWELLAGERRLRPDLDIQWGALHTVVFNLGTVLFARAIDRHLKQPFFTPAQLERWNVATTALIRRGAERTRTELEVNSVI